MDIFFHRLTDNLVALKEIRLEHEEGAPCTAIREGEWCRSALTYHLHLQVSGPLWNELQMQLLI